MRKTIQRALLGVFFAGSLLGYAEDQPKAETFKVSAQTFIKPAKWEAEKTASRMRAAQFSVPGKAGGDKAECVFFYFGPGQAGGAQANLKRWAGQFATAPKPKVEVKEAKVNDIPVAYLFGTGSLMVGPPFGAKVKKDNYSMAAAVLGTKPGYLFVKMTGPKAVVDAARADFQKMIESGLKK